MRTAITRIYRKNMDNAMYFKKLGWGKHIFHDTRVGKNVSMNFILDVLCYEEIVKECDFSEIIDNLRESTQSETIREFSEVTQCDYGNMRKIFSGSSACGAMIFERVCSNLGYDPLEVLKRSGNMKGVSK